MSSPVDAAGLDAPLTAFADALFEARISGRPVALPEGFAQRCSEAQGRAIGARNVARLAERLGGGIVGAKLAATNPAALQKLGLAKPISAPMLGARVFASPSVLPRAGFIVCVVEAELGVRFGADLRTDGARPARDAVAAAVDQVFPVIELADTRIADWQSAPAAAIHADMGYFGALVTGAPCAGWRTLDLAAVAVCLRVNDTDVRQGSGASVMGHPFEALAGFVAERGAAGQGVAAGEIVSTGTWTVPYLAQPGDRLVADFGPLGRVSVDLT